MKLSFKLLFNSLEKEIEKLVEKNINTIPFHINRTLSDNLAVFVKYRNNGNIAFTHVRKVKGNRFILKEEIQQLVGRSPIIVNKDCFIIQGNHKHKIKQDKDALFITTAFTVGSFFIMLLCWVSYGRKISKFYKNHVSPDFNNESKKQK